MIALQSICLCLDREFVGASQRNAFFKRTLREIGLDLTA